jgi:hypothetical protein
LTNRETNGEEQGNNFDLRSGFIFSLVMKYHPGKKDEETASLRLMQSFLNFFSDDSSITKQNK